MHITIAADIFPPQSGGPATYSVALAKALLEQGNDVTVVTLNSDADTSQLPQGCVVAVPRAPKFLRYIFYLSFLLKYARISHVIYAMGPVNAGLPAWIASRLTKRPFIVKVVGDYAWEQGVQRYHIDESVDNFQQKQWSGSVGLLQKIESFVVCHADLVITPSKYLQNMVSGWGAKKIRVIYNAIHIPSVVPVPKPFNEFWFVSAARLVPWKNMEVLVEVVNELRQKYPQMRLHIIGDGPDFDHLVELQKKYELEGVVFLHGEKKRQDTLAYVKAADIFVLNSGYEGLSHAILEAIACGTWVLASSNGGNPEVVHEGENGNLFSLNNKEKLRLLFEQCLNLPQKQHIKNSEVHLRQFAFDTMFADTQKAIESVVQENT